MNAKFKKLSNHYYDLENNYILLSHEVGAKNINGFHFSSSVIKNTKKMSNLQYQIDQWINLKKSCNDKHLSKQEKKIINQWDAIIKRQQTILNQLKDLNDYFKK